MRLTCPNCGAEYEVPDEVIPTSGRDVQCSNCGDTWFQYHPDHMPDESGEEPEGLTGPEPDAEPEPDPLPEPEADPEPETVIASGLDNVSAAAALGLEEEEAGFDFDEDVEEEDEDLPPAGPATRVELRRRSLDPEVQSILREEAQYEERARGQETLESQPDLGLDEPGPVRREQKADSRLARLREQTRDDPHPEPHVPAGAAEAAGLAASSRRNLLPDIEEINSSLRRKGDGMRSAGRGGQTGAAETRRGTRRGFVTVVVILAVAASVYLQAPNIGNAVPQLKGPMTAYVDAVDRGRAWLDRQAAALAAKLDEMAGETAN